MARGLRERGCRRRMFMRPNLDRRAAAAGGSRRRGRRGRRSAGADRGALCGGRRCAGRTAPPATARDAAGRAGRRLSPAALRHRGVADRGGAAARLVSAASRPSTPSATLDFTALWRDGARRRSTSPPTWVLRDYHSPNLLWLPEREGHRAHRPARFPGRGDGARRPTISRRCCRTRASTCRS